MSDRSKRNFLALRVLGLSMMGAAFLAAPVLFGEPGPCTSSIRGGIALANQNHVVAMDLKDPVFVETMRLAPGPVQGLDATDDELRQRKLHYYEEALNDYKTEVQRGAKVVALGDTHVRVAKNESGRYELDQAAVSTRIFNLALAGIGSLSRVTDLVFMGDLLDLPSIPEFKIVGQGGDPFNDLADPGFGLERDANGIAVPNAELRDLLNQYFALQKQVLLQIGAALQGRAISIRILTGNHEYPVVKTAQGRVALPSIRAAYVTAMTNTIAELNRSGMGLSFFLVSTGPEEALSFNVRGQDGRARRTFASHYPYALGPVVNRLGISPGNRPSTSSADRLGGNKTLVLQGDKHAVGHVVTLSEENSDDPVVLTYVLTAPGGGGIADPGTLSSVVSDSQRQGFMIIPPAGPPLFFDLTGGVSHGVQSTPTYLGARPAEYTRHYSGDATGGLDPEH